MNLLKKSALAALILSFFVNIAMAVTIVPECAKINNPEAVPKNLVMRDDVPKVSIEFAIEHLKKWYPCKDTEQGKTFYKRTLNACEMAVLHGQKRRENKSGDNANLCADNFNAWIQAIEDTINETGCKAVSADTPVTAAVATPGAACACRNKYHKYSKDKQSYDPTKAYVSSPNATYTYLIGLTSRTSEQENCCKVMNGWTACSSPSTP